MTFEGERPMSKFKFLAGGLRRGRLLAPGRQLRRLAQSKTLKIIVPYTPGSGPDIISRLMGEQIPKTGGPTVVVENRPGGGTTDRHRGRSRAEPDGNTVLLVANAFAINIATQARQLHDREFRAGLQSRRRRRCRWWCKAPRRGRRCRSSSTTPRPVPASSPSPAAGRRARCMSLSRCCGSPPRSISTTCPMAAADRRSMR